MCSGPVPGSCVGTLEGAVEAVSSRPAPRSCGDVLDVVEFYVRLRRRVDVGSDVSMPVYDKLKVSTASFVRRF